MKTWCTFWLKVGLITLSLSSAAEARDVVVFAAASLKNALDEVAGLYSVQTGTNVALSYAGSSALARQIEQGAPADIYISANLLWMDVLARDGYVLPETRVDLVGNRLVLIGEAALKIDLTMPETLIRTLEPGDRLAMALVDAVPAGIYGKTALTRLGVWTETAPFVAQTDNVRAALRLVSLGEAKLGIVYATDVQVDDGVTLLAVFPEETHPLIRYPAALVTGQQSAAAREFLAFLQSDDALDVFSRNGFLTGERE